MEGKKSCEHIIKIVEHNAVGLFALVHTNFYGMIHPTSLGGAHYFISFTNDFSCFTWLYFLKQKFENITSIQELLCQIGVSIYSP
jgi:hypothetical protein